jgi:hypothetical protein
MTVPGMEIEDAIAILVFVIFTLGSIILVAWKLRDLDERLDSVEGDLAVDRIREIEAARVIGAITQTQADLNFLDVTEGGDRTVVAEWTRPDYRDERIPEPHGKVTPW